MKDARIKKSKFCKEAKCEKSFQELFWEQYPCAKLQKDSMGR